jgi:hypothetical protein
MTLVDLELARKQLRVFHNDEDAEIALYLAAAESIVAEYLDRSILAADATLPDPEDEGYDATTMLVTSPVVAATLLVMSDLYENRQTPEKDAGDAILPPTVRRLLAPWRVWRTFEEDETCA